MHYTIKGAGHIRDIVLPLRLQLQHLALIMIILLPQVLALLNVLLTNVLQATQSYRQISKMRQSAWRDNDNPDRIIVCEVIIYKHGPLPCTLQTLPGNRRFS